MYDILDSYLENLSGMTWREAKKRRVRRASLIVPRMRERSNDDYCRASSIYSPTAFAIIGELPLVNCSRYAVHRGPRIKTSLLPGHGGARAAAVLAVVLVINFADVLYTDESRRANARPRRSRRITGNRKGSLVMITR